jgi:hypothetical protein
MAKTRLWLFILIMSGTILAAQLAHAQALSSNPVDSGQRAVTLAGGDGEAPGAGAVPLLATTGPSLPEAPSAIAGRRSSESRVSSSAKWTQQAPRPAIKPSTGRVFLVASGVSLGLTMANAELIARCRPGACQDVPDVARNRAALYGIGIPASIGISYVSYRLRQRGSKLWIVPVTAFAAANLVYAMHAAKFSR